jgi:type IV pilus assembly protein PilM
MSQKLFYKIFPTPVYLKNETVGLDISDQSIKFIGLIKKGDSFSVSKFDEIKIPLGIIESGQIKNKEELIKALSGLRQKNNLKDVIVSLPEEQAYIIRMKLPAMPRNQIREAIELQLEEYIPLKADQVVFDYEICDCAISTGGLGFPRGLT